MIAWEHDYWLPPGKCNCLHCEYTKAKEYMANKKQKETDFTNLDEVKLLILVNEQAHHNWMSGKPLKEGNEGYVKTHPKDWERLTDTYERMNKALGNPPIKQ